MPHVLDATRTQDAYRVSLKVTEKNNPEIELSRFLTSILRDDNHCIPLLDAFVDPIDVNSSILVTPYLRPMDDPPFTTAAEIVNFVNQMLEVRHGVAVNDCTQRISGLGLLTRTQSRSSVRVIDLMIGCILLIHRSIAI